MQKQVITVWGSPGLLSGSPGFEAPQMHPVLVTPLRERGHGSKAAHRLQAQRASLASLRASLRVTGIASTEVYRSQELTENLPPEPLPSCSIPPTPDSGQPQDVGEESQQRCNIYGASETRNLEPVQRR